MDVTFTNWLSAFWTISSKINPAIVATLFLAIPAYWLAIISRKTARQQLRAYISIGSNELDLVKSVRSGKWGIKFSYKNNGATPAYDLSISTAHVFVDREDIDLPSVLSPYALGAMGPTDEITDFEPTELTDDDIELLKSGRKVLIMFGHLKYTDAFKKKRWTNFRFYTGGSAPYAGPTDTALTIYVKGNGAN